MNQSIQCPICGKEGIPDFHQEDVVCPCCGSDLSIYNRLREVTEINTTELRCKFRNKWLWSSIVGVLIIALMVFFGITNYKYTLKEQYLNLKEAEISALKGKITLLQDSICKINNISESHTTDITPRKDTTNYRLYIVKRGDCFRKISRDQLGTEQRFEEIVTLNHLANDAIIHTGDTLRLPNK